MRESGFVINSILHIICTNRGPPRSSRGEVRLRMRRSLATPTGKYSDGITFYFKSRVFPSREMKLKISESNSTRNQIEIVPAEKCAKFPPLRFWPEFGTFAKRFSKLASMSNCPPHTPRLWGSDYGGTVDATLPNLTFRPLRKYLGTRKDVTHSNLG